MRPPFYLRVYPAIAVMLACGAAACRSDKLPTLRAASPNQFAHAASPTISSNASAGGTVPARPAPAASLAPIVARVAPGVVSIGVEGKTAVAQNPLLNDPFFRRFFNLPAPEEQEFHAAGSGVITDAEHGYVLTNNHVIRYAERITVILPDKRQFEAKLVGTDPGTDVAVVKIPADHLTALPIGDSDRLQVGDFVLALGNPFGLGGTVTYGIVSAKGRTGLGIEGYEDFIQTDASINPGNSGGALVDLGGDLVAINTAIVGPAGGNVGIGFAIPINMAYAVMVQLIKHGKINRGLLGIEVQDLAPELAKALRIEMRNGALVSQVQPGSPAAKAGLKQGDLIVGLDGAPVQGAADLRNRVGLKDAGDKIHLDIVRGHDKPVGVDAKLVSMEEARLDGGSLDKRLAGVVFGAIQEKSSRGGNLSGVEAIHVDPASAPFAEGLRDGDIITSVNRQPVATLQDFASSVRAAGDALLFSAVRGDSAFFIVLR